jgi:hypothetical protein
VYSSEIGNRTSQRQSRMMRHVTRDHFYDRTPKGLRFCAHTISIINNNINNKTYWLLHSAPRRKPCRETHRVVGGSDRGFDARMNDRNENGEACKSKSQVAVCAVPVGDLVLDSRAPWCVDFRLSHSAQTVPCPQDLRKPPQGRRAGYVTTLLPTIVRSSLGLA